MFVLNRYEDNPDGDLTITETLAASGNRDILIMYANDRGFCPDADDSIDRDGEFQAKLAKGISANMGVGHAIVCVTNADDQVIIM